MLEAIIIWTPRIAIVGFVVFLIVVTDKSDPKTRK